MNIYEKLLNVQMELKAPKGQYNKFGNYKYRSCEDILEAVKPILNKYKLTMFISDDIEEKNNKNYIKTTITLINIENVEEILKVSSGAREEENKKGQDSPQMTGTASSYARKYALNGLFAIDDTKDNDTNERHIEDKNKEEEERKRIEKGIKKIKELCSKEENKNFLAGIMQDEYNNKKLKDCSIGEIERIYKLLKANNNILEKKGA